MHPSVKTLNVVASIVSFCALFALMTFVSTMVWEYTTADLYDCTDSIPFPGYFTPGGWVHPWGHRPIAVVHQIVHNRSMSEPDAIKEGWSVPRLWCLWCSFVAVSILVSLVLTLLPWFLCWLRGWPAHSPVPPNHAAPANGGVASAPSSLPFLPPSLSLGR